MRCATTWSASPRGSSTWDRPGAGQVTEEFAIGTSNLRIREPPRERYVEELLAGKSGPRSKDLNMRWVGSMVADVFRILAGWSCRRACPARPAMTTLAALCLACAGS